MPDHRKVRADANTLVAELLERLAHAEVSELEVKRGGVRVRVAKEGGRIAASAPGAANAPHVPTAAPAVPAKALPTVNAPLTGIFYRASSPQTDAFVQVGSNVQSGDVIGLIEAMKLFNEVTADCNGVIEEIVVQNGKAVEFGELLFRVNPG